jgi:hypothetical protein
MRQKKVTKWRGVHTGINTKNLPVRETDIKGSIIKYLCWLEKMTGEIWAWNNPSVGMFDPTRGVYRTGTGLKGVADILGIYKGRPLAIEVKTPTAKKKFWLEKKKLQVLRQQWFLKKFKERGGITILASSVDDVKEVLKCQ